MKYLEKLKSTNKENFYVVYNKTIFENYGKEKIIYAGANKIEAEKLCKENKNFDLSIYPPFTYAEKKPAN